MPRARSVNLEDDSNAGCYKEVKCLVKAASEDHDVKRRSSEDVSSSTRETFHPFRAQMCLVPLALALSMVVE